MRRVLLIVLLLLFLTAAPAFAARSFSVTASPEPGGKTVIASWLDDGTAHLFFPGSWDLTGIVLGDPSGSGLTLDGEPVDPERRVDVSGWLEHSVTVRDASGKKLGTLQCHQGSAVPAMFITVNAADYAKTNKDQKHVISEGSVIYTEADGSVTYDGALTQLKGRGNATYSSEYKKKPYQIKLAEKASLSGMGKGKTWILLANATDPGLLRNEVTLELSRALGLPYTVRCTQTELYVNGEYRGLYLLTEKIQISKSRLNIRNLEKDTEKLLEAAPETYRYRSRDDVSGLTNMRYYELPLEPEDLTGGYLLVLEKPYRYQEARAAGFQADGKLCVIVKEPTYASKAQVTYIGGLIAKLQDALLSKTGKAADGSYYAELVNMDSFAGKFLLELAVKNYDFRSGSQYLYKDSDERDGRICAGPGWDYDLTFGSMATEARGAYITRKAPNNLWYLLSRHEDFMQLAGSMYAERLRPLINVLLGKAEGDGLLPIRAYGERIRASAAMNYVRWSVKAAAKATGGHAGSSFDGSIDRMVTFLEKRVAWMDEYFAK